MLLITAGSGLPGFWLLQLTKQEISTLKGALCSARPVWLLQFYFQKAVGWVSSSTLSWSESRVPLVFVFPFIFSVVGHSRKTNCHEQRPNFLLL